MTQPIVVAKELTKKFPGAETPALDSVSFSLQPGSIIGLIGRNGAGKTTLLHHLSGLMLPTSGECFTLGTKTPELEARELTALGVIQQKIRLMSWLTIRKQIDYVASFYDSWDRTLEERLLSDFQLDSRAAVGNLTPGKLQSLTVILAVCHRPRLLLLDEPVSSLDPIARGHALQLLMRLLQEDGTTIVISSHVLSDVESIVDHILCMDQGCLRQDCSLDSLKEVYFEWEISSRGDLPGEFEEDFILDQEIQQNRAKLAVKIEGESVRREFEARHQVQVFERSLNLERIFPFLIGTAE